MSSFFDNVRGDFLVDALDPDIGANVMQTIPGATRVVAHLQDNVLGKESDTRSMNEYDRTSKWSLFVKRTYVDDAAIRAGVFFRVTHEKDYDTKGWIELPNPRTYKVDAYRRSLGTTRDKTLALSEY